ncbi:MULTISPECIES: hypothetical protein [unclassified Mesorhizobium]
MTDFERATLRKDSDDYDMKVPANPPNPTTGKKIVAALKTWAKRHDAAI